MALPSLASKSRRLHLHRLLLHNINYFPSPSHSFSQHDLSRVFHQTLHLRSPYPPLHTHHFSTLKPFSFSLNREILKINETDSSALRGFLELIKSVVDLPSEAEAMAALDESGLHINQSLVYSAIWELRDRWKGSFLAFKWGEKRRCVDENTCNLIIWVLGNHKKFDIAWCLIREMHRSSIATRQAMLIMIDRYAFANNPSKAIRTFHLIVNIRLSPDQEAFHSLLTSLCNHGNIEEAEEFMLINRKLFPLDTNSFNIILNGWSNILVDILEAKRVWREMAKYCINPDATSYTHMISCFSKVGNLFDSLRLYDAMKKRGWAPCLDVYNSLIYVLTRENCFEEALNILNKIKEIGLEPDPNTYNSMIRPLCEAGKMDLAREVINKMAEENIAPTVETYHAFLESEKGFEGSIEVLDRMRKAGLSLNQGTFLIILRKLLELEQGENALKIWEEMKGCETVVPNSEHYGVMVQGLVKCGMVKKARDIYSEMRLNGLIVHPKLEKLLQEAERGRSKKANWKMKPVKIDKVGNCRKGSKARKKARKLPRKMGSIP